MDRQLVRATARQETALLDLLIEKGASVEFDDAAAIRIAIQQTNQILLKKLLRRGCSRNILSGTIATALSVESPIEKLDIMRILLQTGVNLKELGSALRVTVSASGKVHLDLVKALLQAGAPLSTTASHDSTMNDNCVLAAARKGDFPLLKLLCSYGPPKHILSMAVPIVFEFIQKAEYGMVHEMITFLLVNGATGSPIDETLLIAVSQDSRLDIVRSLLLHHGDANYFNGASYKVAIQSANQPLLDLLCKTCSPNRRSIRTGVTALFDPAHHSIKALERLLSSSSDSSVELRAMWDTKLLESHPKSDEIVECFIRSGVDVNIDGGGLLCFAIDRQNKMLFDQIIAVPPDLVSLSSGFQRALGLKDLSLRHYMLKAQLECAGSLEIGQSNALVVETAKALRGQVPNSFDTLLFHKASPDTDEGEAITIAAINGSLEIMNKLLSSKPKSETLRKVCLSLTLSSPVRGGRKQAILQRLIDANDGLNKKEMTVLLEQSVMKMPNSTELPQLLLQRGVDVSRATYNSAVVGSNRNLITLLVNNIADPALTARLFKFA